MLSTRSIHHIPAHSSAALARHRLLTDRTMRQARTAPLLRPVDRLVVPPLSPDDQRALVQAIAHGFPNHYMAHITYLNDGDLTVATLLPRALQLSDSPGAHRISVDAAGNASVSTWTPPASATPHSPTGRWLARIAVAAVVVLSILTVYCLGLAL